MNMTLNGLSDTAEKLLPTLDALSDTDRLGVVRHLLDRLEGPMEDPEQVRAAWTQELQRRVAEIRSGKVQGIPVEEMFERSRERCP